MPPSGWGRRHLARLLAIAGACALVVVGLYLYPGPNPLDRLEYRMADWRFRLRGVREPDPRLLIVAVDDDSLTAVGAWPWPRHRWAEMVDRLSAAGAQAVVFDIFFPERTTPSEDEALVQATRRSGRVYHAAFEEGEDTGELYRPPGRFALQGEVTPGRGLNAGWSLARLRGLMSAYPELAQAAAGLGYADVFDAGDGVYRYVFPVAPLGDTLYPCLGLRVALDLVGATGPVRLRLGRDLVAGKLRVPLDRAGRMVINFAGPGNTYPRLPAVSVLRGDFDPERVRDKVVFVAATAAGLHDRRPSPFGAGFDGVEIQANILDNLLTGRYLRETPPEQAALFTVLAALLAALLFSWWAPSRAAVVCLTALGLYLVGCVWAFSARGLLLPLLTPSLGLLTALLGLLVYGASVQEKVSRRALGTLERYVAREVAEGVTEEGELSGQSVRRRVTVLFSDLRDFTPVSGRLDPEEVVGLLNRYFTLMHETLREFEGRLDKYLGDGLMAYFLSEEEDTQHAALAVHAAMEMQRRIAANREEWAFHGMPDLRAGIGIATGEEVLGNVGSFDRTEYTVIGPRVNLAARLCQLTKALGADILLDETTWELARDFIDARPLGPIDVPGFEEPQRVYQALYEGAGTTESGGGD